MTSILTISQESLLEKIRNKSATVCVVGLGYVGIPLSVASAEAGFNVIGVDVDADKVESVNRGVCYVEDPYSERLLPSLVQNGKIRAVTKLQEAVPHCNVIIVAVPTPLHRLGAPDLSYLRTVANGLSRLLSDYKLVILESTSYPGTTEEVFRPLLEKNGKRATVDFALVYSPERIDYGNSQFGVRNIPKVVGGIDAASTRLGQLFYEAILQAQVVAVAGPSVAEATKMLENMFRYVNIALVNELAVLHEILGVDFVEAVRAASTKPFGFMAHYPGPGVGGHCIPKDPFYLVYKAKKVGFPLRLVTAAKIINAEMPVHTVDRLRSVFRKQKKNPVKSKVAVWGLAYKGEVRDTRRSPSLEILRLLKKTRIKAQAYDPYVQSVRVAGLNYESAKSAIDSAMGADAIMIVANHKMFRDIDLKQIKEVMKSDPVLFDTRNLLDREEVEAAGFTYIATGRPEMSR
jgi:UDP-N-acetyl-D-glucosamine dehydrogenase